MAEYYLHKVGSQEMGSIGADGIAQRGRYFFISKIAQNFFPHLSSVVMNDKAFINIVPIREGESTKRIISTIDYHNSKFSDIENIAINKRNETRLYLNKELDPEQYFIEGDIIVFQKIEDEDEPNEYIYTLSKFSIGDRYYQEVNRILEDYRQKKYGFHSLYEGNLDFIKVPNLSNIEVDVSDKAIELGEKETTEILSAKTDVDISEDEMSMGASIFNSAIFRDFVMNAYEYKCAITHKVIRYESLFNLEAAHIKPQAHSGTFLPCNGIAMSRDMHFAFDKGFFTIDKNMKVVVHNNLSKTEFYKEYNGTPIFLPKVEFFRPNVKFLQYHNDVIFGTFRQIRKPNS